MMVFKRKQVVVLSLVIMILVAGYLQYSYKKSSEAINDEKENGRLGEAVYVSDEGYISMGDGEDTQGNNLNTNITASQEANNYFAQARLEREITRSKNTDVLNSIAQDASASQETRDNAYLQMIKMVDMAECEMKIESLLEERGFADAIVFFGDNNVDVIVKAPSLTEAQVAQISEIVRRQADVDYTQITVRNKF
ncbi:MAG TPA: SpoIIIAH-like family protein [Clostridiaceae bacterium]|nr:SpoIIIAH-like family protein [Clostridiaceae bacterium]